MKKETKDRIIDILGNIIAKSVWCALGIIGIAVAILMSPLLILTLFGGNSTNNY